MLVFTMSTSLIQQPISVSITWYWTRSRQVWLRQSAPACLVTVNNQYQQEPLPQTSTFQNWNFFLLWTLKFWVSDLAKKNTWITTNFKLRQNTVLTYFQFDHFPKPNIPKYAQDLVVTWANPNSANALLSPPPTYRLIARSENCISSVSFYFF